MREYDAVVVGGGLVGGALAWGLARHSLRVVILDEGDNAFRASRGNAGLVWLHGKGVGKPEYASWTYKSICLWPDLARELRDTSGGVDVHYEKSGGLHFCLNEDDMAKRRTTLEGLRDACSDLDFEMLDRRQLLSLVPAVGNDIVGASFGPNDGICDPLQLLRSLHVGLTRLGGYYWPNRKVIAVSSCCRGQGPYELTTSQGERLRAQRLVLAAGLGTPKLASMVGLKIPIRPQRGQLLVTEKLPPLLPIPANYIRQTRDGTFLCGASAEDVGFDDGTTLPIIANIARRALRFLPCLRRAHLVRAWGALRPMPPDGLPIYAQSRECTNAFAVVGHSGVTLAAVHALRVAPSVADGELCGPVRAFSEERFNGFQEAF